MTVLALTAMLACATLTLKFLPETAVARWLDRMVVARLLAITRTHLIFLILMTIILVAGSEWLAIAGPFDMALALMWDVSAYVDIVLTTVVVATAARSGAGWRAIARRFAPRRARRARRQRVARKPAPSANEDGRRAFARVA